MKTAVAAALVLRETNNPAVMWGDEGLCQMIADRAQLRTKKVCMWRSDVVLRNLARSPGELIPWLTICNGRRVRIFYLPEHAPARARR